jgi:hypothetical protein
MKKKDIILMLGLFLTVVHFSYSQNNAAVLKKDEFIDVAKIDKNKFHLYILAGQSNMAGRGIVENHESQYSERIVMLDKNGLWKIAKNPIHYDKPEAGVGPGLSFAQEMLATEDPDVVIGLIPTACGGSPIDVWKPGGYWKQTNSYPYDDAINRMKAAMQIGTLKGVLWHQGESDANEKLAYSYQAKLITLIEQFRSDSGIPNLPFIAGELYEFNSLKNHQKDYKKIINKELHTINLILDNYEVACVKSPKDIGDKTHFDTKSQIKIGKQYAKASRKINKKRQN